MRNVTASRVWSVNYNRPPPDKREDRFVTAQDAKKPMKTCNRIPPGKKAVSGLTTNMSIFGNEIRDAFSRNHSFAKKKKIDKEKLFRNSHPKILLFYPLEAELMWFYCFNTNVSSASFTLCVNTANSSRWKTTTCNSCYQK